ncbi:MAG: hypothetical protein HOQ47_05245 [Streptomyces sp.]|nr:hypothetical protein [Streptomyces sp.]
MANPKLSTLVDMFSGSALNTAVWNNSSGSPSVTLDTVLDRVQINCTAAYPAFGGNGPWDLTGDLAGNGLYARVSPPPIGNGSTQFLMRVAVDGNNQATLIRDGGGALNAQVINAGVTTTTGIGTYEPYSHAWWRLRESGGNILFDTAPDGFTWTTRATIAHAWAATAVSVVFISGFFGTEAAGLAAFVDHVNTTNSAPGQPNLNWPKVEDAWAPYWNANAGTQPLDRYVEVTDRTRNTASISRGRQYELDQVRSGEASLTLANTDGALDPVNAAGPWYGHIQPYQPVRKRAQWPATRNLLDQVMATGGDLGGFSLGVISSTATDIFSVTDSTNGSFVSSASAWLGSTVMQFAVPSGTVATTRVCHTPRWSVIPGQAYTVQLQVRDVTAATSLSVQAFIGWYTAGGGGSPTSFTYGTASVLTGSTTAGWTPVTVTATAPANAAGMDVGVAVGATAAATCSVQVDGWQLEKGSTATTWQCPGVWYPMYAGWVERWTPSWDMQGTYGVVQPTAVDTFSLLSQQQLSDPLTEEISANSPRFVYKLNDPSGSVAVTDWAGNSPAAQLGVSKYGAGSLTFGTAITAASSTGTYTGSTDSVATVNNSNPGTGLTTGGATFLKLGSAGILGPADLSQWTRMFAFRYTGPVPTGLAVMWSAFDRQRANSTPSGSRMYWQIGSDSKLSLVLAGPTTGTGVQFTPVGSTVVDSNWHLVVASYSRANAQLIINFDGASSVWGSFDPTLEPSGLISDNVGGWVDPTVGNGTTYNYKGDLSFIAEFPTALSSTAMGNIYTAWRSAAAGESSDARYARILRYAGYSGWTAIQTGLTTSMGPAALDGQDAMTALEAVVDTENGAHYVDRAGVITFKARSNRYNATTPLYTFGENAAGGEWPYEDVQLDFDSTHLSNQVTVTQESSGQNFYATDATSIANYFPRTLTRTINVTSTNEAQDAAGYLLSRYKQSAMRVSSLKLHPSANPALWQVCLSLELGMRVRVMRRPPGLPVVQVDCFIENIQWDVDDSGEAWCTLQCSPADLTPYGVFAAWHTTLATTVATGVTSITVNASQDNTNPLAAQLAAGQQLVLGQNTTNQETVTVASVGATSSGWTTATITLTAATTKAHTAGDWVNEPLPSGVTDPTAYDSVAKFDSAAFAY